MPSLPPGFSDLKPCGRAGATLIGPAPRLGDVGVDAEFFEPRLGHGQFAAQAVDLGLVRTIRQLRDGARHLPLSALVARVRFCLFGEFCDGVVQGPHGDGFDDAGFRDALRVFGLAARPDPAVAVFRAPDDG
jgi:hypothetical protein